MGISKTADGILIEGDFDIDDIESIQINGQRFGLTPAPEPEPMPVVVNPFKVGDYVTVTVPKRPDHRNGQSGKVLANTPEVLWDDPTMPQVYVEFAKDSDSCGSAQDRVKGGHGCRMPVAGLTKIG